MRRKWILLTCLFLLCMSVELSTTLSPGNSQIMLYDSPVKISQPDGYPSPNILPMINNRGDVIWYCNAYGPTHWGYYYNYSTGESSLVGSIYGWQPSPAAEGWDPRNLNDAGQAAFSLGDLYMYEAGNLTWIDTPSGRNAGGHEINNSGQIVYSGLDPATGLCEVWRYDTANSNLTQVSQGGGADGRINRLGDIAWRKPFSPYKYGIYAYKDGQNSIVREGCLDRPRLNDLGHVVWSEYDAGECNVSGGDYEIYLYDGTSVVRITNNSVGTDWYPQINNSDQVVWWGTNLNPDPLAGYTFEIFLYDHGSHQTTQITNNNWDDMLPEINDFGQIVWQSNNGPSVSGAPSGEIYLYSDGTIQRLTDDDCIDENPQINNRGQIVWQRTCLDEGTQIYR